MTLLELHIKALPGLESELHLTGLSPGVTVLVGPNASGKSSIVRALRSLWEPGTHLGSEVHVSARFEEPRDGQPPRHWRAVRLGALLRWEADGEAADPPPAPAQHILDSHLIAADTLTAHGRTDGHIEAQLRREMAGGFDLPGARTVAKLPVAGNRVKSNALASALQNLAAAKSQQSRLMQRLTGRVRVEDGLERAAKQARQLPHYLLALDLHEKEARLRSLNAELETFPADMERLGGDEGGQLSEFKQRLTGSQKRFEAARQAAVNAQERLNVSGVADSSLSVVHGRRLERAARRMVELADLADGVELQRGKVAAMLAAQWRQLGGRPGAQAKVTPDELERTEALVEKRMWSGALLASLEAERESIEAKRERLGAEQATMLAASSSERQLRDGQAALARWLAVPAGGAHSVIPVLVAVLATLALVLASVPVWAQLAAGGLAELEANGSPFGGRGWTALVLLALLGVVAVLAWAALISGHRVDAYRRREHATVRGSFMASALSEPRTWTHAAVAVRLEELLTLAAAHQQSLLEAMRLQRLHEENARAVALAQEENDRSREQLRELADVTGYDATASGAVFASWLRAARGFLDNLEQDAALVNELGHHHREGEGLYREVVTGLAGTPWVDVEQMEAVRFEGGKIVSAKLPLAATMLERSELLLEALQQRDGVLREQQRANEEIERAQRDVAAARGSIEQLLAGCGLGEGATSDVGAAAESESTAEIELFKRLALLDAWRPLRQDHAGLLAVVRNDRERLAAAPDVLALVAEREALERGRDACSDAEKEEKRLTAELTELATEVRLTERQRSLEQARAALQHSRDELEELRLRARLNAATDLLFDEVETEHHVNHQPAVLERAKAWFTRFTHHAFQLRLAAHHDGNDAAAPWLLARDNRSGKLLPPSQLSSGTCAQLLLALRIAYAAGVEGAGPRLPFFLDEALTSADAARFKQVARSLLLFAARDERQVFYLSARRDDANLWREAAEAEEDCEVDIIDLVEVLHAADWAQWRGAAPAVADELPPEVPAPNGTDAAAYATALRVPPIDPWRPVDAVHLFHLLHDDLPLLQRLLTARLRYAGQLPDLLASDRSGLLPLGDEERTTLRRRLAGLSAWHQAWREGRDRPVTMKAARESGAVSDSFLEGVTELAEDVGHDPRALLKGLADGQVPYFRQASVDQLEEWFEEHGFLDGRPRLDEPSRILRTTTTMAQVAQVADALSDSDMLEASRLVGWLEAAIVVEKESV